MKEKNRSVCELKQIWADMFDENCSHLTDPDNEYLGLLMLLETALSKTKYISSSHSSSKSTCEKHLAELEWKAQECNRLKAEVTRLETTKCHKCSALETELLHYKKQSLEAQNRIKSIANILKLGDNIDDFQGQRKNSAMTLVSQMLFEESPKRKKRRTYSKSPSPRKIYMADTCDGIIPETDVQNYPDLTSPAKNVEKTEIITSPGDENVPGSPGGFGVFNILKDRTSKSINLPVSSITRRTPRSVKKNLSADFQEQNILNVSPKKKSRAIKQCNDQLSLNGSLIDYVKEGHSELDKIWFNNDASNSKKDKAKSTVLFNSSDEVFSETPEQKVTKKSVWKMKELRGPAEISGNKKLRQLRLNLSVKNKDVDLSSLDGYDGGSSNIGKPNVESNDGNVKHVNVGCDDIDTPYSADFKPPSTSTQVGNVKGAGLESDDIDTPYSADFKPASTSTQKNEEKAKNTKLPLQGSKSSRSPNYKYKRDAVRKKEERMKLDGWDCEQCAKYYGAIGLSPSKIKARMNKCSRHRDKFDKLNQTPADYWNPIFPDTEECRQKKLYVSIRCPRDNDKDHL
ncbi:unnamed protein product [Nezara viridula]|uniref:DNA endonuclease activator Ctp1 C-terminal domain-containing protein n=1 Tax=Nezara viridula TaxID=85310 RepID=A0A9P0H8P5_NEZVI|nr:unnamed protein product [Nezara viridula]